MHTFLNRRLTIFVCLAFGGLATGRAQVQPLPVIPPDALVQTYTGRLAYTLLNGYVKQTDSVYPNGKLYFGKNKLHYIKNNGASFEIYAPFGIKLASGDFGYTTISNTPPATDSSNRVASTRYVKQNLAGFISNDDSRLSDSRTPKGTAGGDLTGTYPTPTIKSSVNLTGSPTTTTQDLSDNSTKIATTAFVHEADKTRKLFGINLSGATGIWTDEGQVFYSSAKDFTVQLDNSLPIISKTRVANNCYIIAETNATTISVTLAFPNGSTETKTFTGLNASKHYLLHILCIKWSSGLPGPTISISEYI